MTEFKGGTIYLSARRLFREHESPCMFSQTVQYNMMLTFDSYLFTNNKGFGASRPSVPRRKKDNSA